jgi:glutamine transport system substrate-binding protein
MRRIIIIMVVVALCLSCLSESGLAKNKYIVATDTNFKPFSFKSAEGVYTGFDVEFWAAIAKEMNIDYKLQPMDFNGIIPGGQSRQQGYHEYGGLSGQNCRHKAGHLYR